MIENFGKLTRAGRVNRKFTIHRFTIYPLLSPGFTDERGAFGDSDAGGLKRRDLIRRGSLSSGNNCSGMPHTTAGRRRAARDKSHYRLLDVSLDKGRGLFFRRAADFSDHHDAVRVGVIIEEPQGVNEGCANDGVAADSDAGRLPNAQRSELAHRFVGQGAAPRYHSHMSLAGEFARA